MDTVLAHPPASSGFGEFLAALTAAGPGAADLDAPWSEELADDRVTLSCEGESLLVARPGPSAEAATTESGSLLQTAAIRDLRTASVTIWMTKTERARLRRRAAESGMTISTYLRSCALEADSLREQVKMALAELKTSAKSGSASEPARPRRRWLGRIIKRGT